MKHAFPPWRIEYFTTIGSTSDLCVERARAGARERLAIHADVQTAGRGRAGRAWVSPAGNLFCSLLLRPVIAASRGGLFALLAGLALVEAIEAVCPAAPRLTLKWPNDVMIDGAKFAGVLLDAEISSDRIDWLVIGCGANLVYAPEISERKSVSLAAFVDPPSASDVMAALLSRIDHWRAALEDDGGAELRTAWLARAHPIGAKLAVDAGRIGGAFAGIDEEGGLLLADTSGHIAEIRSGDVALL